jgi:hypothetical protein
MDIVSRSLASVASANCRAVFENPPFDGTGTAATKPS